MLKKIFSFLFLLSCVFAKDTYLHMEGYLGKELTNAMAQTLDQGKEGERIIIHLSSSSGEIDEVISLAQKIYDLGWW